MKYIVALLAVVLSTIKLTAQENRENLCSVIAFTSFECPLSIAYTKFLNDLTSNANFRVQIKEVLSGNISTSQREDYIEKYKINHLVVIDSMFSLSKLYNATVTPEVVLLDVHGKKLYQGAIDNWLEDLGRKRNIVTAHYLLDAIEAHQTGKPILRPYVQAKGCFLNVE